MTCLVYVVADMVCRVCMPWPVLRKRVYFVSFIFVQIACKFQHRIASTGASDTYTITLSSLHEHHIAGTSQHSHGATHDCKGE